MRDHLLLRGFIDGYRWQGDEDDYEVVHGGRARNEEGQQDNHRGEGGREDEESLGHDHDGDVVHNHHVEDVGYDDEEDEDAEADNDGPSMDWVQDPHIQELLLKQTDNARATAREKAQRMRTPQQIEMEVQIMAHLWLVRHCYIKKDY